MNGESLIALNVDQMEETVSQTRPGPRRVSISQFTQASVFLLLLLRKKEAGVDGV